MKQLSHFALLILAIVAATSWSCTKQDNETISNGISFKTYGHKVAYKLNNSADEYMRDSDIVCVDSALIILPTEIFNFDLADLQKAIVETAFEIDSLDVQSAMEQDLGRIARESGYDLTAINADSINVADADGFSIIQGYVESMTGEILTYCISRAVYNPGAAHGMTTYDYVNYSITDGKLLTLDNLFTAEGLEKLPAEISKAAKKSLGRIIDKNGINQLPERGNFCISDGVLYIIYQPYEIAAYSEGVIPIRIEPYNIPDLLSPLGRKVFKI